MYKSLLTLTQESLKSLRLCAPNVFYGLFTLAVFAHELGIYVWVCLELFQSYTSKQ